MQTWKSDMKRRQRELVFLLMWDTNLEAIRGLASSRWLSIRAAALLAACTQYLIRLDEFQGEGRATEYRFVPKKKEEMKGQKSFHYLLHEFQWLECKHKRARWQVPGNVACLAPEHNYCGVFSKLNF